MTQLQMLAVGYVFFMTLIAVEAAVSRWRADGFYTIGELVVNIGHGVVYQVFDHLTKHIVVVPFAVLSGWVSWQVLPTNAAWAWVVGFVAYDFCSYWCHRHHHEVHALWAVHGVHHAAEDFNLAAALRQPAFQGFTNWFWRLPLALVMPVRMFIVLVVVDFLYQFVLHTRYVGKLGPLEWVLNTPSHHRVHHGWDEEYSDRNYGGMLIVWDRMFGTFQEERQEPEYGVTKPLNTLNAVWGNFAIFRELWQAMIRAPGLNKVGLWLRGPEALARLSPAHRYQVPTQPQPDTQPPWLQAYVLLGAMVVPPVLGWMLLVGGSWSPTIQWAMSGWLVWSVVAAGALLEGRRWVRSFEVVRWLLGVVVIGVAI